jgi:hypothetical protein
MNIKHLTIALTLLLVSVGCGLIDSELRDYNKAMEPIIKSHNEAAEAWVEFLDAWTYFDFETATAESVLGQFEAFDRAAWQLSFTSKGIAADLARVDVAEACRDGHLKFLESVQKTMIAADMYSLWMSEVLIGTLGQSIDERLNLEAAEDLSMMLEADEVMLAGGLLLQQAIFEFEDCS